MTFWPASYQMSQAQQNFDKTRGLVAGTTVLQSSSVALPGGSAASPQGPPGRTMSFPAVDPSSAPASGTSAAPPSMPVPDASTQGVLPAAPVLPSEPAFLPPVAPAVPPSQPVFAPPAPSAAVFPADLPQTSPLSSMSTPEIVPLGPPLPLPHEQPRKLSVGGGVLGWIRRHRRSFALLLLLLGIALVIFFTTLTRGKQQGTGRGGGGGSGGSPKDFVVHLAQGSTLELQGLSGSPSTQQPACGALQGSLDKLSRQQEQIAQAVRKLEGDDGVGDDDARDLKKHELKLTRLSKEGSPGAGGKVHYSSNLSTQALEGDAGGRWVQRGGELRTYGGRSPSDMTFSQLLELEQS